MPTDENNGVNPQNQQLNPGQQTGNDQQINHNLVWNKTVSAQDSGDPDDFDFSFSDNQSWGWWDIQAQMKREWRSWMFLSPDEDLRKKAEEQPSDNVVVPTKKRSWMFLTPDEESEKEIAENDGETFSFHDQNDPNWVDLSEKEDEYLAGIDPSDVEDDPTDKFNTLGSDISKEWEHDWKLDEEIEDLISFDNSGSSVKSSESINNSEESVAVPQESVTAPEESVTAPEEPVTPPQEPVIAPQEPVAAPQEPVTAPEEPVTVPEEPVTAPEEPVIAPEEPVAAPQEPVTAPEEPVIAPQEPVAAPEEPVIAPEEPVAAPQEPVTAPEEPVIAPQGPVIAPEESVENSQSEKNWLDEEDQKVNDTFWTSDNLANENIIKDIDMSPENVAENVENVITWDVVNTNVVNNDLAEENNLTNVWNDLHVENLGTDVVENSNGDLVSDLWKWNVSNQQYVPNEAEFSQMSNLLNSSSTGPIDLDNINNPVQNIPNQDPVNDFVIDVPTSTENQINLQIDSIPVENWVETKVESNQVESDNNVAEQAQWTIDLDKIQWWISLDSMIDNDIQDIHVQPQQNESVWQQNQSADVNQDNVCEHQPIPVKKHKKQSWFIILWVFGVLLVAWFIVYKMFPDKIVNLFKHDIVVEYLTWNENNNGEWNEINDDENQWWTNADEFDLWQQWENSEEQWSGEVWEEVDPNSLAWLLEWYVDDNDESKELSGDNNQWNENQWNVGINDGEGSDLNDWSKEENQNVSEEWEFDPFSEMNALLGVDEENKSKLNNYISKWQYYVDWWTENSNSVAKRYWEVILTSAQEQLTKLENWEEIDTTLFDRFDNYLKVLSDLENNN